MVSRIKNITRITILTLTAIIACGDKQGDYVPGSELKAGETIRWYSLTEGLDTARKNNKGIFIFFYTDWCVYCKKMDRDVFSDADVIAFMNKNFINIRVNADKDSSSVTIMGRPMTVSQIMNANGVEGYPGLVFWDKKQQPITTIPGYIEKKIFMPVVKYMASECYLKKIPLQDYVDGKVSCGTEK